MNEDKATRYHRQKRLASFGSLVWTVLLLGGLLATGLSEALRQTAERAAGRLVSPPWLPGATVLSYVVLLTLINELGSLPLGFYSGFLLEHRYALSRQTLGAWVADQVKALAVALILGAVGAGVIYALIRQSPDWWWLEAGAVFALFIVALTNLAPVVLLPLFYTLKPLDRAALRDRLLTLAERAGARVLGAYEWGLGGKTKKANAALTGLGATRRILVSDTMLAEYSHDEIEVVLAHELAHHVHGDIWKSVVFESALVLAGFDLASLVLRALVRPLGLRGVDDVAGLPLLLLAAGAVSLVTLPVTHAMSRAFERSADRFALDLTRNPAAFISAMRRLGAQHLAEEHPSRLAQWLFYSHPPVRERIAAAQTFHT
ncbi:MAG: M48 family metallopeptidase [Acidobacteria bacterium]|nr:M48 family metallopeptidase [Acidobacteriota bacterium]